MATRDSLVNGQRKGTSPLFYTPFDPSSTAAAYRQFLAGAGLDRELDRILTGLDMTVVSDLQERERRARAAVLGVPLPAELVEAIRTAYAELERAYGPLCDVAVRSSATAEDLPEASVAGQQETFLNVRGPTALLDAVHRCLASLFTDRAISYRTQFGFAHRDVALSVGVQRMVRSDLGAAGVMFSLDTETGFRDVVLINAAYGLGESVVQGAVNPDEYRVFKPTLREGFRPILERRIGSKETKLVYEEGGSRGTRTVPVSAELRGRGALTDDDVLTLARWACAVEDHYSERRGGPTPMDMEWAKDGESGEMFLLQARPETVHARPGAAAFERYHLDGSGEVLVTGRSVGQKIGAGRARVIRDVAELDRLEPGEVLVAPQTDPDWEPVMKRAAAIVTDRGGRTCHAAIVSRELGVPAIVGTEHATARVKEGDPVTVSCAEGEEGRVYRGEIPFHVDRTDPSSVPRPRTKLMLNVGNPSEALALSFLPQDGVGLARIEFIITAHVRVHPMALLHPEQVSDAGERREIERMRRGYADPGDYFVERLAEGVGMIAAAFWPKEVIVRLSDFKTNEYASLLGGAAFEPHEENPMLGFRGASRYYDRRYREGFALECRALAHVRDGMGLRNLKVMVPFCRTVEEARKVVAELAQNGLRRGENGLELYVMCEIPSNVVLAEAFAEHFDGFSIGSNDLTQLVLGVDRDSEVLAGLFDEHDEAVLGMITHAIRAAHRAGRRIGICGQAPSDYPEFARALVREEIDSISLTPDALLATLSAVAEAEEEAKAE